MDIWSFKLAGIKRVQFDIFRAQLIHRHRAVSSDNVPASNELGVVCSGANSKQRQIKML